MLCTMEIGGGGGVGRADDTMGAFVADAELEMGIGIGAFCFMTGAPGMKFVGRLQGKVTNEEENDEVQKFKHPSYTKFHITFHFLHFFFRCRSLPR